MFVALVAVMFRMLFYRLAALPAVHTHRDTHTELARRQVADRRQSRVECRLCRLWTAPAPCRAAVQNCYIYMSTCKCVSVCVCLSPGVVHAESCLLLSCGQLLSPFCPLASGNIYRTSTVDEQRVANDFNSRLRLLARI